MIVASMPMWSPTTRSNPAAEATTPRMKLPPPITMATCTPCSRISLTSSPRRAATLGSTPKPWVPSRASPLSLSSTRLKTGSGILQTLVLQPRLALLLGRLGRSLAHLESRKAPNGDVLTKLGNLRSYQLAHRRAARLVLDEVLVVETVLFEELA